MTETSEADQYIGPYLLGEPLGEGGMGIVYRAVQTQTSRKVALKTVRLGDPSRVFGLRREIRALTSLRHPGIVRFVDEGMHAGLPWYAMELLHGATLDIFFGDRQSTAETRDAFPSETVPINRELVAELLQEDSAAEVSEWWTRSLADLSAESLESPTDPPASLEPDVSQSEDDEVAGAASESTRGGAPRPPAAGGRLQEVVDVMHALCLTLAYIHGEGVVHRDLKPENILGRANGQPVIMDFGLFSQVRAKTGRETLDLAGRIVGTAAYMSPEQVSGAPLDPRADLYGLGCIFYELVTGLRPFRGTVGQILAQQLDKEPMPPSYLVEIPAVVEELILAMLLKDPKDRPAYAEDVAATLRELGAADIPSYHKPAPRPYLYRAEARGRDNQLFALRRVLARAGDGEGRVVLVHGESGIGKTRLLRELGEEAGRAGYRVLVGECSHLPGGLLEPLRRPLRGIAERCLTRRSEATERFLAEHGPALAAIEPAFLTASAASKDQTRAEPSQLRDPSEVRLFAALRAALLAAGSGRTTLLVLDDLQWADEGTLQFLAYLAAPERLRGCRLLVAGAYRTDELPDGLFGASAVTDAELVPLHRLSAKAVRRMVGDMLAVPKPPSAFLAFILRQSEGNPYFISEYLRLALEEEVLVRDDRGRWRVSPEGATDATQARFLALRFPPTLHQLMVRRLERLEADAVTVLEITALAGREVPIAVLADASGLDDLAFLTALEQLYKRHLLEDGELGRTRFTHGAMRDVALNRAPSDQQTSWHEAIALAIEHRAGQELDAETLGGVAVHWEKAGCLPQARFYYAAAARRARDRYALDEAGRLFGACLALAEQPTPATIDVRLEMARTALLPAGNLRAAQASLELSLSEAHHLNDDVRSTVSLCWLARALEEMGHIEKARTGAEQALAAALSQQQLGTAGHATETLCRVHRASGDLDRAIFCGERAISLFEEAKKNHEVCSARVDLGEVYLHRGAYQQALAQLDAARAHACLSGSWRAEAQALAASALLSYRRGRLAESDQAVSRGLALATEVGDRRTEAELLWIAACLRRIEGDTDKARGLLDRSVRLFRFAADRRGLGRAQLVVADLAHERGDFAICDHALAEAGESLDDTGDLALNAIFLCQRAMIARRLGRPRAEIKRTIQRSVDLARRAGDPVFLARSLCESGHLEILRNQPAAELLAEAQALAAALRFEPGDPNDTMAAINRLVRAEQALHDGRGDRLFRGEARDTLAPALLRKILPGAPPTAPPVPA
ncbi:MAG: AAA family ATPase [Candidatus Schekmanbacteria bacterium]|nr:AAA family ATPase [Candidatus Schekmanbacteria bacterium]